jgi:hypothetical protein
MDARPQRSARPAATAVVVLALLAWTSAAGRSSAGTTVRAALGARATDRETVRIAAAGDIACASAPYGASAPDRCQYDETSDLLVGKGFARVLALGDNQYDVGAYRAYLNFYDPWWDAWSAGRALSPATTSTTRTRPRGPPATSGTSATA